MCANSAYYAVSTHHEKLARYLLCDHTAAPSISLCTRSQDDDQALTAGPAAAGMAAPPQHVEEAWQSAEFYVNKVCMLRLGAVHYDRFGSLPSPRQSSSS